MTESESDDELRATPAKVTTAGRLLRAMAASGHGDLGLIGRQIKVSTRRLQECRDGIRPLDVEQQILLAAVATVLAPEHERLARHLHAQAQSALRVREGSVDSHSVYNPGHRWNLG
jgi:hypothetical protein